MFLLLPIAGLIVFIVAVSRASNGRPTKPLAPIAWCLITGGVMLNQRTIDMNVLVVGLLAAGLIVGGIKFGRWLYERA
ncbi:MAG TPA: hypothetical protein VFS42_02080 [Burkholderiaceae bacterium]|nr:hypothetical protein [Burkholderiaceae bacterium]